MEEKRESGKARSRETVKPGNWEEEGKAGEWEIEKSGKQESERQKR